jgi:hypothetical protein
MTMQHTHNTPQTQDKIMSINLFKKEFHGIMPSPSGGGAIVNLLSFGGNRMDDVASVLAFLTEVFRPDGRGVELSRMGRQGLYNILRETSDKAYAMAIRGGTGQGEGGNESRCE